MKTKSSALLLVASLLLLVSLRGAEPRVNFTHMRFVPSDGIIQEAVDHFGSTVEKMLAAIQRSDQRGFVLRGDDRFQKLTQEQFSSLTKAWAARLHTGFEVTYLGDLNRGPAFTTLWRVRFADRSEDAILTLSAAKRGSITSFILN